MLSVPSLLSAVADIFSLKGPEYFVFQVMLDGRGGAYSDGEGDGEGDDEDEIVDAGR